MKSFDMALLAEEMGGEYVLGKKDLHSRACYMIYGILDPNESDRLIKPGEGYEEILCAINGSVTMGTSTGDLILPKGHAVHLKEHESFYISNNTDKSIIYILAGGLKEPPQSPSDTEM